MLSLVQDAKEDPARNTTNMNAFGRNLAKFIFPGCTDGCVIFLPVFFVLTAFILQLSGNWHSHSC